MYYSLKIQYLLFKLSFGICLSIHIRRATPETQCQGGNCLKAGWGDSARLKIRRNGKRKEHQKHKSGYNGNTERTEQSCREPWRFWVWKCLLLSESLKRNICTGEGHAVSSLPCTPLINLLNHLTSLRFCIFSNRIQSFPVISGINDCVVNIYFLFGSQEHYL